MRWIWNVSAAGNPDGRRRKRSAKKHGRRIIPEKIRKKRENSRKAKAIKTSIKNNEKTGRFTKGSAPCCSRPSALPAFTARSYSCVSIRSHCSHCFRCRRTEAGLPTGSCHFRSHSPSWNFRFRSSSAEEGSTGYCIRRNFRFH